MRRLLLTAAGLAVAALALTPMVGFATARADEAPVLVGAGEEIAENNKG